MVQTGDSVKLAQSNRITALGCAGLIVLVILLVMIGAVAVRSVINSKRAEALDALGRMREQVDKAPGILDRMVAYDCGDDAGEAAEIARGYVDGLEQDSTASEIERAWDEIEGAWATVNRDCSEYLNDPSYVNLTTEMEGVRNRLSVEEGKYRDLAEVYNSSLMSFPGNLFRAGFEELE